MLFGGWGGGGGVVQSIKTTTDFGAVRDVGKRLARHGPRCRRSARGCRASAGASGPSGRREGRFVWRRSRPMELSGEIQRARLGESRASPRLGLLRITHESGSSAPSAGLHNAILNWYTAVLRNVILCSVGVGHLVPYLSCRELLLLTTARK